MNLGGKCECKGLTCAATGEDRNKICAPEIMKTSESSEANKTVVPRASSCVIKLQNSSERPG